MSAVQAAEHFLLDFHAAQAGATSRQLGAGRLDDGRSTYAWLADAVDIGSSGLLLDLACGDGHLLELFANRGADPARLVGVDMSDAELSLAAGRAMLAGARLERARAQALPLADGSVGAAACHMALMLMDDVERVAAELARVSQPGAGIAMVVGGGVPPDGAFAIFAELFGRLWREEQVANPVRLGDPRTFDPAGLASLFAAPRFEDTTVVGARLHLDGPIDAVWANLAETYDVAMLDEPARDSLRAEFKRRIEATYADLERVPMSLGVLRLTTRRSR